MSKVRIVFLGTPEIAVTCLKGLVEDEHFDIVGVVTQPDRPAGRKMQLQPSAVKSFCLARGLRVISPDSVNTEVMLQELESWGAEAAVVVAFGQILGDKFLKLFPLGAVNVHGSLLPRWRGAAPIQRAIEMGDLETGVVLQKVVKKLDAGDVLGWRKVSITDETDSLFLYDWMGKAGANLLSVEFMDYIRGNLAGQPQDETLVTYAKKIDKSEGLIQWEKTAREISQKVRAFVTGPGTWTFFQNKKIKIHKVQIISEEAGAQKRSMAPGTVVKVEGEALWVETGLGILALQELQPESRNRMKVGDFLKGNQIKIGDQFQGGLGE